MEETTRSDIQEMAQKLFRGAGFKATSFFIVRLFQVARIVIFARLFLPAEIGIASLTVSSVTVMAILANYGFAQSVIRGKEKDDDYFHTIFTLSILFACVVFIITWVGAPFFSHIFSQSLEPFIRFSAVMVLIIPVRFPVYLWEKNLNFGHPSVVAIINEGSILLVSILVELIWNFGVWSLLAGTVSGFIFSGIYVWFFSHYRPSLVIKKQHVKPLFDFGAPIMVQGINGEAMSRGDNLMVGAFSGVEQLAFYNFAWQFPMLISSFSQSIDSMLYPVFVKLQEDKNSIRRVFNLANKMWSLTGSFLGFALFVFTEPIVMIMYGESWRPVIPILRIMSLSFILRFCTGYAYDNLVLISGRTKYTMKWGILNTILIFTVGQILIRKMGPIGGAWFWMLQAVVLIPLIRLPLIMQELGTLEFVHHVWQPLISGLIACIVSYSLIQTPTVLFTNYILELCLAGVIYLIVYFSILSILDRQLRRDIIKIIALIRTKEIG